MIEADEQFDAFAKEYAAWQGHTQALKVQRARDLTKRDFDVDLEHLIDYIQPVLAAAARRSTRFDYSKVAPEYLHELDLIRSEVEAAPIRHSDREAYIEYLSRSQRLLTSLGLLPVPPEGHLGFIWHAINAFGFLKDEYGFEVVETSPISVRFATDAMFVDVSYWPECPMESILIGRRTDEATPISGFILDDFGYVAGLGVVFDYERFNLRDSDGVAKFLETAAALVHSQGGAVLSGRAAEVLEFQNKAEERERRYIEMMERQNSSGE